MRYGLLYDSANCHITGDYLRQSIPLNQAIKLDLRAFKPNVEIQDLLQTVCRWDENPDLIVHEIGAHGLPRDLDKTPIRTACLDIDTFGWTELRVKWGMLFDCVITWHPSYVRRFQEAGHPSVLAIPHAVDCRLFPGTSVDGARPYEVGFVGNFGLPQYVLRDRINARLAGRFKANEFQKRYSKEETVRVYEQSRIVVNVSRTEFPQEANMRCYEAMAGGALLITGMPTELTEWGFREGEHFIGWGSEEEIPDLVDQFLRKETQRLEIACAGQRRTLEDFTYQRCLQRISDFAAACDGNPGAPARDWVPVDVHLVYLSYYHRFKLYGAAIEEFRLMRGRHAGGYREGLPMVLKSLYHGIKSSLM